LLLLAPPGAGKGTQGERLAAWSGARHIAAGDLLRAQARAESPLGREIAAHQARGDLVPDQIVLDVLTPAVVEAAAYGGYILDGFPRTLPQATAAAELAARLGVTLDGSGDPDAYIFHILASAPRAGWRSSARRCARASPHSGSVGIGRTGARARRKVWSDHHYSSPGPGDSLETWHAEQGRRRARGSHPPGGPARAGTSAGLRNP